MKRALVALLLLTSACGARLTDEQLAGRTPTGATVPAAAVSATTTTVAAAGAASSSGGSGAVAATAGGSGGSSGASGAGAGDGGTAAATCTPTPVDEVGISDTEIVLGNVSMLSGPIPGAGQTGIDGARAYLDYINSIGGVCGRTLRLVTGDDRTEVATSRSETVRLSREVFGLVGGASIVDAGAASALEGTDVPAVQVAVDDAALASPNIFSPSPIEPTGTTLGSEPMWRYFARTLGLSRVSVVTLSISSARARADTYVDDITRAGLEIAGFHEIGLAESNFVGLAQQLENEGADGFISLLDPVASARLAQAIRQVGWAPVVAHYGAQNYGQYFLDLAGDAAEGTTIPLAFSIFEDAPTNPTVARFTEWFARVAPGRTPDFYGAMGWASADMMVQALEAAGPAPTRAAVLGLLGQVHAFDAHGFLAPCDPAGKVTAATFMVATVHDGRWTRTYPASGFADGS